MIEVIVVIIGLVFKWVFFCVICWSVIYALITLNYSKCKVDEIDKIIRLIGKHLAGETTNEKEEKK